MAAGAAAPHDQADLGQRDLSEPQKQLSASGSIISSTFELKYRGRSVQGSVWILPGQPDESMTVDLGWGRWHSGRAGNGAGFNAYDVRTSDALWTGTGVELRSWIRLIRWRPRKCISPWSTATCVIRNTLEGYKKNPDFAKQTEHEPPENLTLYPQWNYTGYAWAMSIDLTACVNCQACVVACQAENNIAVVGKEQVLARRAMHWLQNRYLLRRRHQLPDRLLLLRFHACNARTRLASWSVRCRPRITAATA